MWFRLTLGGITGHHDFGRETGVVVKPADATKVADAVVRVFIDHGDRTNRTKARLKYVLDKFGIEKFLELVEEKLGAKLARVPHEAIRPRPRVRPRCAYRRSCAEAAGLELDRRRLAGRKAHGGADARRWPHIAGFRRRRYSSHRLAEFLDFRITERKNCRC